MRFDDPGQKTDLDRLSEERQSRRGSSHERIGSNPEAGLSDADVQRSKKLAYGEELRQQMAAKDHGRRRGGQSPRSIMKETDADAEQQYELPSRHTPPPPGPGMGEQLLRAPRLSAQPVTASSDSSQLLMQQLQMQQLQLQQLLAMQQAAALSHPVPTYPPGAYPPAFAAPGYPGYPMYPPQFGMQPGLASHPPYGAPPPAPAPEAYEPSRGLPSRNADQDGRAARGRQGSPQPDDRRDLHARGRGPGEGPASQSKMSYAEELKYQMQQKQDRIAREKKEREDWERKKEMEAAVNPFGKGGAGAPQKKADVRSPEPPPVRNEPSAPQSYSNADPPEATSPSYADVGVTPGAGPGPGGARRKGLITNPEQPGQQQKRDALAEYQDALRKQMEDAVAKKKEAQRRKQEEDAAEARRIVEEQLKQKLAFEEEQRKQQEKEEAARRDAEEKAKQAQEKRRLADEARKKADEEREKAEQSAREEKAKAKASSQSPSSGAAVARAASPPIPALRGARAPSPPIPTLRKEPAPRSRVASRERERDVVEKRPPSAKIAVPAPSPAPKPTPAPTPALASVPESSSPQRASAQEQAEARQQAEEVRQQLANLRIMLEGRQQAVTHQIARQQEQFDKIHHKKPGDSPAHHSEIFDRARKTTESRGGSKRGAPAAGDGGPQEDVLKAFNDLKYRDVGAKGNMAFLSAFPEPPTSMEALDEQQRALLFEQERQLKALKGTTAQRPGTSSGTSLVSMPSFNLDAVVRRNEHRAQRLQQAGLQTQDESDSVLQQFLSHDRRDASALATESVFRNGTASSLL